ncbi:MAG: DUF5683 domain-containing protein [bacterium]
MYYRIIKRGKNIRIVFLLFSVVLYGYCFAQSETDSLDYEKRENVSPTTAVIRSAVLPGLGQLYNGKIFKAILVFGGEAALAGNAVYYNQQLVQSSSEDEREFYRDIKSRFLWWLFAVHLLNVIDAYVDASLFEFDTGPDLSFSPQRLNGYTVASIKFSF